MENLSNLEQLEDRQWLAVYVSGATFGIWLIAFALVIRFAANLGFISAILVSISVVLLGTFAILFAGELLKAQTASRALTTARMLIHKQP